MPDIIARHHRKSKHEAIQGLPEKAYQGFSPGRPFSEIFDSIHNLLCEGSGDIWCHSKNSSKLLTGCFVFFFLGMHFFISKVDIIVKREGWIIGNDKTNACLKRKSHMAVGGQLFKGSQN